VEPDSSDALLSRARTGDRVALSELFAVHAPRLARMVSLRLDNSLGRRLEPADIVQDALIEATRRFPEWCAQERYPFSVWLRLLTAQTLQATVRDHHREKRDVAREEAEPSAYSALTAARAADWLLSTHTSPTQAARRMELRERVLAALEELGPLDREVLVLRYFEQLSNEDAAAELGIDPAAASKRFARALQRIRPALRELSTEDRQSPS
jgi:RNA polymerase sigma-70 factor (ECF subfamily)